MELSTYLHDVWVYDAKGRHVIGHLLSLNTKEMVFAADLPPLPGHTFSLMLEDITELEPGKKVKISGRCESCEVQNETLDVYIVKLTLQPLGPKALQLAQALSEAEVA